MALPRKIRGSMGLSKNIRETMGEEFKLRAKVQAKLWKENES